MKLRIGNRNKYLLKNMIVMAAGSFSSKLVAFLLVPLYTAYLTTKEYGVYDLSWSMIQLLFPLLTLNVVDSSMVFYIRMRDHKRVISMITAFHVLLGIAVMGILTWILTTTGIFPDLKGYEHLILLYFTSYGISQFLFNYSKGLEHTVIIAKISTIGAFSMLTLNILLLAIFQLGLSGFYWANIGGQCISIIGYLICLRFDSPIDTKFRVGSSTTFDKNLWKKLLNYSIPLITVTLSWWVNNALDKYVVAWICGTAATGILAVSYKLPSIMNAIQQIFIQSWHISGASEYGKSGSEEFYRNVFLYLNAILSISCGVIIIFCRPIAHIMFSKDFYEAWQYTPLLLLSSVISGAAGFFGPILSAKFDSANMARSGIYGAITNALLNILLVKQFGMQGAMVATVISTSVIYYVRYRATGHFISYKKHLLIILSWLQLLLLAILEIYDTPIILRLCVLLTLLFNYRYVFLKTVERDGIR